MANSTIRQLRFIKENFYQSLEGMLASFWCTAATLLKQGGTTLVTVGRAVTNEKWEEYTGLFHHVLIIRFNRH